MEWTTIIEPFRIHSVEPMRMTTPRPSARPRWRPPATTCSSCAPSDVLIDLLTDSGTGAMSPRAVGRRSSAATRATPARRRGSASATRCSELFPFEHVIPTHQGRAAERILFSVLGGPGKVVPNNTHFDTTRANIEFTGAEAVDLVDRRGRATRALEHPFKGNMDVDALERAARPSAATTCRCVMVTVTNNSGGGQPVSLENLRGVRAVVRPHGVPLFLDACRFAENAWFIREREPGQADRAVADIVREMASLADGMTMQRQEGPLAQHRRLARAATTTSWPSSAATC